MQVCTFYKFIMMNEIICVTETLPRYNWPDQYLFA